MVEKHSDIVIPAGIKEHAGDLVRWTAFPKDGAPGGEVGKWTRTACYAGIMQSLGAYEIHCRPRWTGVSDTKKAPKDYHYLPNGLYKKFWRLCKESGLVHDDVKVYTQHGQNRLIVPRKGWDRHTVYTALSLYRHCDAHPQMIARAVLLHKKLEDEGIPFLQCLHYAMARRNCGTWGHTFISVESGAAYQSNCGALNIAAGMALASFAEMNIRQRKKLDGQTMSVSIFCQLAKKWNPIQIKGGKNLHYSPQPEAGIGFPQYKLKSIESILLPEFAPFYEDPNKVTAEQFAEAMKGKCDAEK